MKEFIELLDEYIDTDREFCDLYGSICECELDKLRNKLADSREKVLEFVKKLLTNNSK